MIKNDLFVSQYYLLDCENSQLAMTSIANYYRGKAIEFANAIDDGLNGEQSLISIPISYSEYIDPQDNSGAMTICKVDLSILKDIDIEDPTASVPATTMNSADIEIPVQELIRAVSDTIDQSTGLAAIMSAAAEKGLATVASISDIQSRISAMGLSASSYICNLVTSCPPATSYMTLLSPVIQSFSRLSINRAVGKIQIPGFTDFVGSASLPVGAGFSTLVEDAVTWLDYGIDAIEKTGSIFAKLFSGLGGLILGLAGTSITELKHDFVISQGLNGVDVPYMSAHFTRSELTSFITRLAPFMSTSRYKNGCSFFPIVGHQDTSVSDALGSLYVTNTGMMIYCSKALDYVDTHGSLTIPMGNVSLVVTAPSLDNYYVHLYLTGSFNPQLGSMATIDTSTYDWNLVSDPENVNRYQDVPNFPVGASNGDIFNWMKEYLDLSSNAITNRIIFHTSESSYADILVGQGQTPSDAALLASYDGFGTVFKNAANYDLKSEDLIDAYWHRFELFSVLLQSEWFDYENARFYGEVFSILLILRTLAVASMLAPFDDELTIVAGSVGFIYTATINGALISNDDNVSLTRLSYYPYSSNYLETFCVHAQTYSEKANEYRKAINAGLVVVGVTVAAATALKLRGKLRRSLFKMEAQASQAFYGLDANSTPSDYKAALKLDKKFRFFSKILGGSAGTTITDDIMSFREHGSRSTESSLDPQLQRILSVITPSL